MLLSVLFVPWKGENLVPIRDGKLRRGATERAITSYESLGTISLGYAPIFAPPSNAELDLGRLLAEWVAIGTVAAVAYFTWDSSESRPQ